MSIEKTTKEKIVEAFRRPEITTVENACDAAGIKKPTFYFHFYKDQNFKRQILELRVEKIRAEISAIPA